MRQKHAAHEGGQYTSREGGELPCQACGAPPVDDPGDRRSEQSGVVLAAPRASPRSRPRRQHQTIFGARSNPDRVSVATARRAGGEKNNIHLLAFNTGTATSRRGEEIYGPVRGRRGLPGQGREGPSRRTYGDKQANVSRGQHRRQPAGRTASSSRSRSLIVVEPDVVDFVSVGTTSPTRAAPS